MPSDMKQVFSSAISWWLLGPIIALLMGSGSNAALEKIWLEALVMLPALGLFYGLLRYTYYEIQPGRQQFRIVSGPMVWQVPVQSITSVRPSFSPFSSPALSLDRLRIRYDQSRSILISPADRAGFLTALLNLNPVIRHD